MSLKTRLGLEKDPVLLMDGSAFVFRGFFAHRGMSRSDGFPTNALVVVSRILLRILRNERPRHFAFILDGHGGNFRHEIYPDYKANRDATPEDLIRQIGPVKRMVVALGLHLEVSSGCEADDCIASLAARLAPEHPVVIVSGDKDLRQCLGPNVFMWDPAAREEKLLDAAGFTAESGIPPERWADAQALIGDSSDNIPGVPGIGPRTARDIFAVCSSLEDIRDNLDRLPPKLRDKLRPHLESMFLWRRLTRLALDRCQDVTLDDLAVRPPDAAACMALGEEFELVALRRELESLLRAGRTPAPDQDAVPSLLAPPEVEAKPAQPAKPGAGKAKSAPVGLLEMAAPAAAEIPPAPEARIPADLPSCAGRRAALLLPERGDPPRVAVETPDGVHEAAWTGSMDDLAACLSQSSRLILADAKAVLRAPWGGVLARVPRLDLGLADWLLNPDDPASGLRLLARHADSLDVPAGAGPASRALLLADRLEGRLEAAGMGALLRDLEDPLIPVLAEMEERGVRIDLDAFRGFLDEVSRELDRLTAEVHAAAGGEFNIRSAQQLGEVLFGRLGLPAPKRTRGGQASTSQETLEKLEDRHPVVAGILRFRKLEKIRSTYLEPLPHMVDADDRLHTTFNQTGTGTGRLSSSGPNLQNIPVRGPLGGRMRACFAAAPGRVLVSADYSQVELRVLAHMSGDPALLEAFREGEDIHARTAALIYDIPRDQVSADQRRNAKTVNFGLIYGMGAQKLGRELGISLAEAKDFVGRYFERLSGLKAFYARAEEEARERGCAVTIIGRRRPLPDIVSGHGQAAALARRQAVNTVIQGSAADIVKLAMLAAARDARLRELDARLLLQVHDELLLEVPEENAEEAAARTSALMSGVRPGGRELDVPLVVDAGWGRSWGEAH